MSRASNIMAEVAADTQVNLLMDTEGVFVYSIRAHSEA